MPMTEEDQLLVAKAVLLGVRFSRTEHGFWSHSLDEHVNKLTIGRAAAMALRDLGLLTTAEFTDHDLRSWPIEPAGPQDVDCDGW